MKNRTELIDTLNQTIKAHNNNRTVSTKIEQFFLSRNISMGEITPFWVGINELADAPDIILFLLTYTLYDITGDENVNPVNYFSQIEMKDGLSWKKDLSVDKVSLPVEIPNVVSVSDNQWLTVVGVRTLKQWYYDLPIIYNFNTQRYAKFKRSNDGSIITLKSSNTKAISEIRDRLLRNKQFPDTITLNVLSDGHDRITYDSKRKLLVIHSGEINILDGDHRMCGILEFLHKNPESDMMYELRITNFDEDTAKRFQDQVQTVNQFSKVQREALKMDKTSNKCVKRIMSGDSDFGSLIAENPALVKVGECLASFTTISRALHYCFSLDEQMLNREVHQIADWVSEFVDEIIGLYPNDFVKDRLVSRSRSFITHENMFIGYIGLASELRGNNGWRNMLASLMERLDFSLDNPIWTELKITTQRSSLTKGYMKKVCDYFVGELR